MNRIGLWGVKPCCSPSWAQRRPAQYSPILYLRAVGANGSNARDSPSSTMQIFGYGYSRVGPAPSLLVLIHRNAWKGNSPNFTLIGFCEVRPQKWPPGRCAWPNPKLVFLLFEPREELCKEQLSWPYSRRVGFSVRYCWWGRR